MKIPPLIPALIFLALAACSSPYTGPADIINEDASPPYGLPFEPLKWRVITSAINHQNSTMSVLFGNDLAVDHARTVGRDAYPAGAVLALVTWPQKDDEHWYGARIPGPIQSIEYVQVEASDGQAANIKYQDYECQPLQKTPDKDAATTGARITDILGRKASVMP